MKQWILIVLALVLAVTIWAGSYFGPVLMADCVVRVSFTGLENIFHVPYEYYAVLDGHAVRVADWVVERFCPEAVSGSKYRDTETTQWFVTLYYMPREAQFESETFLNRNHPWLSTSFGDNYRIYYHHWGGAKKDADSQIQSVMQQAAHYFHDGDINHWSSMSTGTGERSLTWFIFVSNGEQLLVRHQEDALYLPGENGTFQQVMECPQGGQFEYFWFP